MKEIERLKSYIFWQRLTGSDHLFLHISKFPSLKKYAKRILTLKDRADYYYLDSLERSYLTIPYCLITSLDPFWKKVFKDLGFTYCITRRAFFFADFWATSCSGNCWDRALKFVEELERRGYLDEEEKNGNS